tara:strand:+ start:15158 stop:15940 length:783 start_codon:yes stop_codon:yes gene_type:complete
MKAIFLTYDKHRLFAKQCLMTHERSGAFSEIQYLFPWNESYPEDLISLFGKEKIIPIKTEAPIKKTIETLLQNVEDDEWVYWVMNDNYIDKVVSVEKVKLIIDWVKNHSKLTDYGVQMFMGPYNIEHGIVTRDGYIEHQNEEETIRLYKKSKITYQWRSQICRAKVIKTMFSCLDEPKQIKDMDYQLLTPVAKPFWDLSKEGNFYAAMPSVTLLAEQINKSKMTKNCADSFIELGLQIPDDIEVDEKMIIKMPPPGPFFI